jgi:glyoxylase-like metal-dependent hydrolase (beta-lactamase superfamily II)
MKLPMPATLGSVNAYLIEGPEGSALVDTGLDDQASRQALRHQLRLEGLSLENIDTVVCTHHHADHAGLGRTFQESGATVKMSREDAELLAEFMNHPERDGEKASFGSRHELPTGLSAHIETMFPFLRKLAEPFQPDVGLDDGQTLNLGGIRFEVVATPGHTPGHVALRHEGSGMVLSGDAVITTKATHISPRPETESREDSFATFIETLERLQRIGPVTAFPGHGGPIADLQRQAARIEAHLRAELALVERRLSSRPQTAFELSNVALDSRRRAFPTWLSVTQTLVYLNHLLFEGRVRRLDTDRGFMYRVT